MFQANYAAHTTFSDDTDVGPGTRRGLTTGIQASFCPQAAQALQTRRDVV